MKSPGVRYDWAALDPLICALYATPPPAGAATAFCRAHDLSAATFSARRQRLIAAGQITIQHKRRWSAADLDRLYQYYGAWPLPRLARTLGRSPAAVEEKARAERLRQTARAYTLTDLTRALGVHHTRGARWIAQGWLDARPRLTRSGWRVSEAAIHRFLCADPVDWRRLPCPDRAWLDAFVCAPDLCRAHRCRLARTD